MRKFNKTAAPTSTLKALGFTYEALADLRKGYVANPGDKVRAFGEDAELIALAELIEGEHRSLIKDAVLQELRPHSRARQDAFGVFDMSELDWQTANDRRWGDCYAAGDSKSLRITYTKDASTHVLITRDRFNANLAHTVICRWAPNGNHLWEQVAFLRADTGATRILDTWFSKQTVNWGGIFNKLLHSVHAVLPEVVERHNRQLNAALAAKEAAMAAVAQAKQVVAVPAATVTEELDISELVLCELGDGIQNVDGQLVEVYLDKEWPDGAEDYAGDPGELFFVCGAKTFSKPTVGGPLTDLAKEWFEAAEFDGEQFLLLEDTIPLDGEQVRIISRVVDIPSNTIVYSTYSHQDVALGEGLLEDVTVDVTAFDDDEALY